MAITVIFYSSGDFTEAIQKHFVISAMILVIPKRGAKKKSFNAVCGETQGAKQ